MPIGNMVININKTKTLVVIFGCFVFVALGLWIIFEAQGQNGQQQNFYVVFLLCAAGGLSVAFFGLCLAATIWRYFSNNPGLKLNNDGITIFGAGQPLTIKWQEIEYFSTYEANNQKILVVHIYNPEKYAFTGGKLREKLAQASQQMCGSPISIAATTLDIKFEELKNICEQYLATHGAQHA